MNKKQTSNFLLGSIILLYAITSFISTWHVIEFFRLSNPTWLAVILAIAFEVGAAASLASILLLDKLNKTIIWLLFILLTLVQVNGNIYYAYTHVANYQGWIDLFGLSDFELIAQKRILSIVSGAVLPLVALGFIKSLVDYIKPESETPQVSIPEEIVLVNKNEPAVAIVEPIIELVVEEPIVEEVIEPVVEEPIVEQIIEPVVEEPRFTEEQNNILDKINIFK
jgi:hypothetical protein